jgi:glycosyltransferase involved in cell wall biosynthesis
MLETDLTTPFADFLRSSPNPLVSVVVVSFDKGAFLAETIESILAQTYPRLEIVIVNDGSNDNTSDVASRYVTQRDDRTVLLLDKQNGGVSDARNAGFKRASARVVMTVDGDDVLTPEYIETAVSTLRDGLGDIFFSNQ